MKNIVAIILARGNSKGIPQKNIINFCGKPLLVWSIQQAKNTKKISSVWVSSDNKKILNISEKNGANIIVRPNSLSTDTSSSESGWLHAINSIEKNSKPIDLVIALQPTSPIREVSDIENGIRSFYKSNYDSMFSASYIGDFFIWQKNHYNNFQSINYNYKKRPRRQEFQKQYVENGSFYIFKPNILRKYNNRFGGKIGITLMEFWKTFEINDKKDLELCKVIMNHYILKNKAKL